MMKMANYLNAVLIVITVLIGVGLFTQYFANSVHNKTIANNISQVKGKVIGFDGKLLAIEFDKSIIKSKGDTHISSFLVSSDGKSIQLKPVIIPEKKAKELTDSKTLVFPVSDILSLLEPRMYAIEVFISNTQYSTNSIQLPLIKLDLRGGDEVKTEAV